MTQGVDFLPHFRVLGLRPGASADEIREAYLDMVKVWHPDRFGHDPRLQAKAGDKLRQINIAYGALRSHWTLPPPRKPADVRPQPATASSPSHKRIPSWPATAVLLTLVTLWPGDRSNEFRAHDEVRQAAPPPGLYVKKSRSRRTQRRTSSRPMETNPGVKPDDFTAGATK